MIYVNFGDARLGLVLREGLAAKDLGLESLVSLVTGSSWLAQRVKLLETDPDPDSVERMGSMLAKMEASAARVISGAWRLLDRCIESSDPDDWRAAWTDMDDSKKWIAALEVIIAVKEAVGAGDATLGKSAVPSRA